MKRAYGYALGIGLALSLLAAPAAAQIRVDVGVRTPHVRARVGYGDRPARDWRDRVIVERRRMLDWAFVRYLDDYEHAHYREFIHLHPEFRYAYRARLRQQIRHWRARERQFERDQRLVEREFNRWLRHEHQRAHHRGRSRDRGRWRR